MLSYKIIERIPLHLLLLFTFPSKSQNTFPPPNHLLQFIRTNLNNSCLFQPRSNQPRMNSKRNNGTRWREILHIKASWFPSIYSWVGDVKRPSVTQYRCGLCHWKCLATRNTITRPNFGFTLRLLSRIHFSNPLRCPGHGRPSPPSSLSLCLSFTFSHSDSRPRNTFCDLNFVSRDKLPDKSDFRPATKSHPRSKAWLCLDAWLPNSSSFFSSLFRFVPSSRPAIPWNPIGSTVQNGLRVANSLDSHH